MQEGRSQSEPARRVRPAPWCRLLVIERVMQYVFFSYISAAIFLIYFFCQYQFPIVRYPVLAIHHVLDLMLQAGGRLGLYRLDEFMDMILVRLEDVYSYLESTMYRLFPSTKKSPSPVRCCLNDCCNYRPADDPCCRHTDMPSDFVCIKPLSYRLHGIRRCSRRHHQHHVRFLPNDHEYEPVQVFSSL